MTRARTITACLADAMPPIWPEHTPTFTLDRQIAAARDGMGKDRWQQLQKEWEQ
jgi:hypothetical protein